VCGYVDPVAALVGSTGNAFRHRLKALMVGSRPRKPAQIIVDTPLSAIQPPPWTRGAVLAVKRVLIVAFPRTGEGKDDPRM